MILISVLCTTKSSPTLHIAIQSFLDDALKLPPNSVKMFVHESGTSNQYSLNLIESYPHLFQYSCFPDSGIYYGMNYLISEAKGLYSFFLNSDDLIISGRLICLYNLIINTFSSSYDGFVFDSLFSVPSNISFNRRLISKISLHFPFLSMPFPHGSFVVRSSILRSFPFLPYYGLEADYAQLLAILSLSSFSFDYSHRFTPLQVFSVEGASSKKKFFSNTNPYLREINILLSLKLPLAWKIFGIMFRIFLLLLLFPLKLINLK